MSVLIRRAGLFSQKLDEEQGREGEKGSGKRNERSERANKWGTCTEGRESGCTVALPASVKREKKKKKGPTTITKPLESKAILAAAIPAAAGEEQHCLGSRVLVFVNS